MPPFAVSSHFSSTFECLCTSAVLKKVYRIVRAMFDLQRCGLVQIFCLGFQTATATGNVLS